MRRLPGRRLGATVVVLCLSLPGCGPVALHAADVGPLGGLLAGEAPPDPPPGTSAATADALRVWRDFPVDAPRRPIVLSGSDAHEGNDYTGIPSLVFPDPQALPAGPAEADGYPVIGARDALSLLRRDIYRVRRGDRTHVDLTAVRFGTGRFWTDRGLQRLPAWLVDYRITEALNGRRPTGTAYILAVAPQGRYGPVGRDDAGIGITPDGMTLLVTANTREPFEGPCRTVFAPVAVETRAAVAFEVGQRQADPAAKCPAVNSWGADYSTDVVEVPLERPLGNRVAVRAEGGWYAYPVLPCGQQTWALQAPICGEPPGTVFLPSAPIDPATLGAWSDFPAYASPRPLVVLGDGVIDANFDSYWDTRAYNRRRWDVPGQLPATPAEAGGYPVIGAAEALERLRDGVPESAKPGRRLTVTDIRLGTHEFDTDRGSVTMPAWIFSFRGADYPGVVAAVAEPARYLYPMREGYSSTMLHGYQISPDGRTMTVFFRGIRRPIGSSCDADHEIARAESGQVVVVEVIVVRRRPGADSDPSTRCVNGHGHQTFTFPLLAPLGGRAVVDDPSGIPLRVIDAELSGEVAE